MLGRHTPRMRGIEYAAAFRFHRWRLWNTGSFAFTDENSRYSIFKQPVRLATVIASVSEAIYRAAKKNGLLRRFAPRNDDWRHIFAISPRIAPELCQKFPRSS
jgi:hypothetical protein